MTYTTIPGPWAGLPLSLPLFFMAREEPLTLFGSPVMCCTKLAFPFMTFVAFLCGCWRLDLPCETVLARCAACSR